MSLHYVDHLGNFRDTPLDPEEKEEVNLDSIQISTSKKLILMRKVSGKVSFYDTEKGFGFIKNTETQDSYIFSILVNVLINLMLVIRWSSS